MKTNIQPWQLIILALLAGMTSNLLGNQDAPVSNDQDPGTTTLGEGVAGFVTTSENAPVENAQIQPQSLDPNGPPIPERLVLSMADGRYEWPLPAGRYELTVMSEGYPEVRDSVVVVTGQVTRLDFVLQR